MAGMGVTGQMDTRLFLDTVHIYTLYAKQCFPFAVKPDFKKGVSNFLSFVFILVI